MALSLHAIAPDRFNRSVAILVVETDVEKLHCGSETQGFNRSVAILVVETTRTRRSTWLSPGFNRSVAILVVETYVWERSND